MLYIGIDLGTSSVKLLLMDAAGNVKNIVSREYPLYFPNPGWSEQNPEDWFAGTMDGLKELLEKYPTEDVSPLATDMLKGIAQGKSVVSGTGKSNIWEVRLGNNMANDSTGMATDSIAPFTMDKESPHLLVLVYPTDSVSSNQLLFDVAKYNFSNFLIKDFDLEIISFNEISMLIIKGFNNFDELSHYRKMIEGEKGIPLPPGVRPVMISDSNFKLLLDGRSFEDYFNFVQENQ